MKAKTYFDKNGFIFGDSYKYSFGRWIHNVEKFTDWEKANKWLHTEQYDFRTRKLITKTESKRLGYQIV